MWPLPSAKESMQYKLTKWLTAWNICQLYPESVPLGFMVSLCAHQTSAVCLHVFLFRGQLILVLMLCIAIICSQLEFLNYFHWVHEIFQLSFNKVMDRIFMDSPLDTAMTRIFIVFYKQNLLAHIKRPDIFFICQWYFLCI